MKPDNNLGLEKLIWFRTICLQNGLELSSVQLEKMNLFVRLLLDWNKKINLISRKDEENIWDYHILHSISLLFQIKIPNNASIVDIGTGGGLPGIPLKIMLPDISLLCIDSVGKKAKAVTQMIEELRIPNSKAVWGRAEEIAKLPEHKYRYDFVIARSVAPLTDLLKWSYGFLKKEHGISGKNVFQLPALLTYKGGDLRNEINDAKTLFKRILIEEITLKVKGTETFEKTEKKLLIVKNVERV